MSKLLYCWILLYNMKWFDTLWLYFFQNAKYWHKCRYIFASKPAHFGGYACTCRLPKTDNVYKGGCFVGRPNPKVLSRKTWNDLDILVYECNILKSKNKFVFYCKITIFIPIWNEFFLYKILVDTIWHSGDRTDKNLLLNIAKYLCVFVPMVKSIFSTLKPL